MTDKEIIIDGVDVSKCEHINICDNKIKCVILQDDVCETNPYCEGYNCYYKQLKRKEQECEELRKQLERKEENYQKLLSKSNKYIHNLVDENVQDISNLARQLDQLKTELEQEYEDLRTHCKHIDETNKILYNEKVQLLDKNQELQDKLLKLNDLAHEVLLYELQTLDIDFDEYETHVRDTEFSPIVTRCTEMIDLIGYKDKDEV